MRLIVDDLGGSGRGVEVEQALAILIVRVIRTYAMESLIQEAHMMNEICLTDVNSASESGRGQWGRWATLPTLMSRWADEILPPYSQEERQI